MTEFKVDLQVFEPTGPNGTGRRTVRIEAKDQQDARKKAIEKVCGNNRDPAIWIEKVLGVNPI